MRLRHDGPGHGLVNPPTGIGAEAEAEPMVKLLHRTHEADIALLHQVEQRQAAVEVFLRDGHHQAQIGGHHGDFGLLPHRLPMLEFFPHLTELLGGQAALLHHLSLLPTLQAGDPSPHPLDDIRRPCLERCLRSVFAGRLVGGSRQLRPEDPEQTRFGDLHLLRKAHLIGSP
jgi:hypothetical protein